MPKRLPAALGLFLVFAPAASAGPPADPGDPGIEPAQFVQPAGPVATPQAAAAPTPPTPAVQLSVLVPQDAPPKGDVTYTLKVLNTTGTPAHKVVVRMPTPVGGSIEKCDPAPDANRPGDATWTLGRLGGGESKTITVKVRPNPDAKELSARGYVTFEHGLQVTTRLSQSKLKVKTEAPKFAELGKPIPVRVTVTNEGKVAVPKVKLTANVSTGFDFDRDTQGEKGTTPQQRVWDLGGLPPGTSRLVEYRVSAKEAKELLAQSVVSGDAAQDNDQATCTVREARLKIDLRGDPNATPDAPAEYTLTVRNTGTMPLSTVRVGGTIPDDCKVVKMTTGGQQSRGRIDWVLATLAPGDSYEYRYRLSPTATGRRRVKADAVAAQGAEDSAAVETVFQGAAVLTWTSTFDQPTVPVDKSGMFTVVVKNSGTEAARGVRLTVALTKEVSLVKATPRAKSEKDVVTFEPVDVPAGRYVEFSVQFRGEKAGEAHFEAKLLKNAADKPLVADKLVQITSGGR